MVLHIQAPIHTNTHAQPYTQTHTHTHILQAHAHTDTNQVKQKGLQLLYEAISVTPTQWWNTHGEPAVKTAKSSWTGLMTHMRLYHEGVKALAYKVLPGISLFLSDKNNFLS